MTVLKGYYAVAETKQGSSHYYYAIYDDGNTYKVGDKVIVSGRCRDILEITDILAPEEVTINICAEAICKVDTTAYNKLKKEMDKMIKAMDESKKYEMYAEESPELAEMLNEYKSLV